MRSGPKRSAWISLPRSAGEQHERLDQQRHTDTYGYQPLTVIAVVLLDVEQHDDEQIQHQNGSGIDDDLHGRKKFGMECNEEPRNMEEHDQERKRAVDGVSQHDHQDGGYGDHPGKVSEKQLRHETVPGLEVHLDRTNATFLEFPLIRCVIL